MTNNFKFSESAPFKLQIKSYHKYLKHIEAPKEKYFFEWKQTTSGLLRTNKLVKKGYVVLKPVPTLILDSGDFSRKIFNFW